MDLQNNGVEKILSRKSVRKYVNKPISDEIMELLLKAGMSGPSCVNSREWEFVVIRDKKMLKRIAENQEGQAFMLPEADAAIIVLGNVDKAYSKFPDYWIIDCSIAAQNIILAANELGIGSVWLGTYPEMVRVNGLKQIFHLPDHIMPLAVISLGYPNPDFSRPAKDNFDIRKVHYEVW